MTVVFEATAVFSFGKINIVVCGHISEFVMFIFAWYLGLHPNNRERWSREPSQSDIFKFARIWMRTVLRDMQQN